MKKPNKHQFRKYMIVTGWLVVWQLLSLAVDNPILMVGPITTLMALLENIVTTAFWKTVCCSVLRITAGFLAGVFVGLIMAAMSARFSILEEIFSPVLSMVKAVPVASFVVLFLIWWRSDWLSVAISFCVVLPNIYVNTLEGIRHADHRLLEMAKVFRLHGLDCFFYIFRPALRPFLDSGIRVSVGMSWKSGVAAEVIGTPDFSIGERLYMSKIYLNTADVLAWTVMTVLLSAFFEKIILWLWNAFCKWEPSCKGAISRQSVIREQNTPLLTLDCVSKTYNGRAVVDNLSVKYAPAKTVYFRTPSGSGKTTLFRLMAGLEQPDSGQIHAYGRIGMVFQEDRLCEDYSAVKNVEMITGSNKVAKEHLLALLDETDLDKPCRELSGGMKRRVAIARAFASQSDILLLDEPFTGLDSENCRKVQTYMQTYQNGRTLLIATHMQQDAV